VSGVRISAEGTVGPDKGFVRVDETEQGRTDGDFGSSAMPSWAEVDAMGRGFNDGMGAAIYNWNLITLSTHRVIRVRTLLGTGSSSSSDLLDETCAGGRLTGGGVGAETSGTVDAIALRLLSLVPGGIVFAAV
jgi:hypothetical protein